LDAHLYFTDKLTFRPDQSATAVPSLTQLDLRLGWRPASNLEISLTGRNLLKQRYRAYLADDVTSSLIPRSVLAQIRWTY
ncbi:MAG: hypothetical protein WEK74_01745, partial [Hydrogenophaga sp.]